MTRRAAITPDMVGLPAGGRRRVPGLRREEVAHLAGVSTEYYTQVERGNDAIVAALRLTTRRPRTCSTWSARPGRSGRRDRRAGKRAGGCRRESSA